MDIEFLQDAALRLEYVLWTLCWIVTISRDIHRYYVCFETAVNKAQEEHIELFTMHTFPNQFSWGNVL